MYFFYKKTEKFSGSSFLNNFLGGVVELAIYIVLIFTIDKVSRKNSLGYSLLIGGVACLVSTVFNHYSDTNESIFFNCQENS